MSLSPVDVEGVLVGYLDALLPVSVSTRVPNPRPQSFVQVTRTGGAAQNLVQERPVVLVECWAPKSTDAWALAAQAWTALQGRDPIEHGGVELSPASDTSISAPVNYPDPSTSSARYQFTAELIVNLAKGSTP